MAAFKSLCDTHAKDFQYVSPSSSPCSSPAPPRHLSNGVSVPGGLGPVYPGGKMAAFKSLCDTDLDTDCDEPLVIAETPAPESITLVHLDDNEEEEEEEEEEEIMELPVPVENHVKPPGPPSTQDRKAPPNTREEITANEVKEKSPPIILNGGGNHDPNHEVIKNSILPSQTPTVDTGNHLKNNHVMKEPEKLTSDELRSIYLRNNNVRQLIYKEVKKPGKGHSELWEMP